MDAYAEVSETKYSKAQRRLVRQADGSANRDPLVVSIDLSNIEQG